MSRIGKQKFELGDVKIEIKDNHIRLFGPKGELDLTIDKDFVCKKEDNIAWIEPKKGVKDKNNFWGLYASLLSNKIIGVSKGFEKKLEINGVGYRWQLQGNKLDISIGFSHPVIFELPKGVDAEIDKEKKNVLILKSIDKELLGKVASKIRALKKPEPYKGKGIKYIDEVIQKKAGKTGSSGAK